MAVVLERLRAYSHLITLSHSVFALPFALLMLVVVAKAYPVSLWQVFLLIVCVVAARSAAMAFNRLVDARFDAENQRTSSREIPSGKVSQREAIGLVALSSCVFLAGSMALGMHCAVLAIPVLLVLLGYSLVKRYSALCHFVLGLALSLAPGGVWYAITATWSWYPVPLMLAVLLWVAGFDVLYACQDLGFDRQHGLFSIPSRLGSGRARLLSVLLHAVAVLGLITFGLLFELGFFFWIGMGIFVVVIASQHITVMRSGLTCIDRVFFTRNGIASIVLFCFTVLDAFWGV
jgi:4-hydroxybenzoate polyprenyltransferase